MVVAVYPKLGALLQARGLTVAELERQIEERFALGVDRKTLYRLTYHEPVRRVEMDVVAAAAAVLGVPLADLFDVEATPVVDEPGDLTLEENRRMAELMDAQARRPLGADELAELEHLVAEYGRRLLEREWRDRAQARAVPVEQLRQEARDAAEAAAAWLRDLDGSPSRRRALVQRARGTRRRGAREQRTASAGPGADGSRPRREPRAKGRS